MNPFIDKIEQCEITNLAQLKSCYRKAIKLIHPDISGKGSGEFLLLQEQFREASDYIYRKQASIKPVSRMPPEELKLKIFTVFIDLISSNFPQDKKICNKNRIYNARIAQINEFGNLLFEEQNLFYLFQKDLYTLRKDTVISNHSFNITISYLNIIKDCLVLNHKHGREYIKNTYPLIFSILTDQRLANALKFINWLVSEILGKEAIRGDLPVISPS